MIDDIIDDENDNFDNCEGCLYKSFCKKLNNKDLPYFCHNKKNKNWIGNINSKG